MKLTEFMDIRYKNCEDKDNIFGVGVSDAEFRHFIIDYLLGEDWYVVGPVGQTQINEIALCRILESIQNATRKNVESGDSVMNKRQIKKNLKKQINKLKFDNDLMRQIISNSPKMKEFYDLYNKPLNVNHTTMRFRSIR